MWTVGGTTYQPERWFLWAGGRGERVRAERKKGVRANVGGVR